MPIENISLHRLTLTANRFEKIMIRNILLLAFLSVLPLDMSTQLWLGYKSDSVRIAEYRENIGLDYSVPNYSVTTIDEKKWTA